MRMLGGGKAFTLCHSLQTNGKIESSCWITTSAIWWRGIAKIQNEVQSTLQESLVCKMLAACLLLSWDMLHHVTHVEHFSFLCGQHNSKNMSCRHVSWPKGPSDIWGISKASSLLRSNHRRCHQCIRCLPATNPRDGRGWEEARHESFEQALEWAKHAHSLLRCPPSIWRWRRLDAKRFLSSATLLSGQTREKQLSGELKPTVPLPPSFIPYKL